ncbi:unnamed protein product [Parajaminaea phylloscopi]
MQAKQRVIRAHPNRTPGTVLLLAVLLHHTITIKTPPTFTLALDSRIQVCIQGCQGPHHYIAQDRQPF